MTIRVAIQGQEGSFHDQAAHQWYGQSSCEIIPCTAFADVFLAYESGEADAIVCAVENTIYGSINEVYQLVEDCSAPIIGEVKLPIAQQLIAAKGASRQTIQQIYSHPVALAQCRQHLYKHYPQATLVEFFDTAGAVEYIKSLKSNSVAAIAGAQATNLYDMPILEPDIQDSSHNYTRFFVLEATDPPLSATAAALVITAAHKPGALAEVLQIFAQSGANLQKLQSQPIINKPWEYKFYVIVDCAGQKLYDIVAQIEQNNHEVVLLGEYQAAP